MAKRLAQTYQLHVYDGVAARGNRIDLRIPMAKWRALQTSQTLWAASSGDVRTLRRLFDDRANLADGDYDLRTPMHLASAEGHIEVVRFLLEQDVDPNTPDRWGGMPLDDAELAGHADVVELLRQHNAVNGKSEHPSSESKATEQADHYGDADAVVEMLWAAADDDIEGLRRCLANGIPISASDYDGRSALHLAAAEGKVEATKYLLAHDHPIHVRDRWNSTPLDEARREGREAIVDLLILAQQDFHAISLRVDTADIARAANFVHRFTAAYGINPLVGHRINVVLDDVLSNIVSYGYDDPGGGEITLEFDLASDRLNVVVADDGREFDPLAYPGADSATDLDSMEISGMGIELLRQLTEDVNYRRFGERNILTLSFALSGIK